MFTIKTGTWMGYQHVASISLLDSYEVLMMVM